MPFVLASVVCLLPAFGLCGDKPVLVLFGLEDPHGVLDWKVRNKLTGRLAGLIDDCGHELIPPAEIQERLKNRFPPGRRPQKRTTIARSLGAWATLVTRIQPGGEGCRLDVFLYNLKSSSTEKTNRIRAACGEESLEEALPDLAGPLCEYLKTKKIQPRRSEPDKQHRTGAGLDAAAEALAQVVAPGASVETRVIGKAVAGKPVRVSIVTDPEGAAVQWDGKPVGKTPLRIDPVKPGWHRLVLEAPGCVPLKESLEIQGSIEMRVSLFLRQRKVRVLTNPPGAEVTVDGRPAGNSPVLVSLKTKQTHRLVARMKNHQETFFEFKPKPATAKAPPQEVTIELEAQPVYVMVDVHPPAARVEIGAGDKQERIVGSGTMGIIPGKRKVIARLEGYVTVEKEVEFLAGKSVELRLRLKPIPGYTDTKGIIRSKRIQAFAALGLSVGAFSVVGPLLKWSSDSERASDEWLETSQNEPDPRKAEKALDKSHGMADRAGWTEIAGYAALGVGIVSLGWSLYSFLSCPDDPQSFHVAPTPTGSGSLVFFSGRF
jgi:hypothetical protein